MWFVFAVAALLAYAAADLCGKKCIDLGNAATPMELLITSEALLVIVSFALYASGLGESGLPPWKLLWNNPLIFLNLVSYIGYWLLFLLSMRYVGLTVDEAVSGSFGVFYFVGLLFLNLVCGKLDAVRDVLHPLRLIPVLIVLAFDILLPNVEVIASRKDKALQKMAKTDRRRAVIGLLILFAALALDSVDSLVTTLVFDEGNIGTLDYIMTTFFSASITLVLFSAAFRMKYGRWHIPFSRGGKNAFFYAAASMASSVLYSTASSYDAVRTGILLLTYPIVPILGARILLKEKYTWRQYVCIWTITLAAIAFCAADALL